MAAIEEEVYQNNGEDLEDLYDEVIMSGSHTPDDKGDGKVVGNNNRIYQNNGKLPTKSLKGPQGRMFQLYIGNLTWWTSDKDISEAIHSIGVSDLMEIKIFDNRSNGQSKGFCQASFGSDASVKTVIDLLPKSEIHGKNPSVTYTSKQAYMQLDAQNKPQLQGGPNKQQSGKDPAGLHMMSGPMHHMGPNHGPSHGHHGGPRGPPPMRGPPPPHGGPQGPRMPPPHLHGNFIPMSPHRPPMQQPPMRAQMPPPHFQQGPHQGPPPQGNHQGPPPPGPHNIPPGPRPEWRPGPPQQNQVAPPPPYISTPNMGGPPPNISVQQQPQQNQPPFFQHQAPPQQPLPTHSQVAQSVAPQRYNYGQPPQVQVPPARPPPQIRSPPSQTIVKTKSLSEAEFDDIMARNRNVSSSAITRAVSDAAAGDYTSAVETLVTAITLIKQSKVAHDDRCKIIINTLEDTLRGVEPKLYLVKRDLASRSPSRERDRDRVAHSSSRATSRRDRSRSRERYRDRSRDRHSRESRDHKDRYYEYRDRERERDRDRSWERERDRERERERERDRERKHGKSPEHSSSSSKYRSGSDQVSSR